MIVSFVIILNVFIFVEIWLSQLARKREREKEENPAFFTKG
jgi:hypothetical protein